MRKIDPLLLQSLELQNKSVFPNTVIKPILSLDWGEKFCGLAWTPDGHVCLPIGIFHRTQIENMINKIVQEKDIHRLVIGLPISGNGNENHICNGIREFAKSYKKIPIEFCNERGSSQATLSHDTSRIDDLAAVRILEQHLRKQKISSV